MFFVDEPYVSPFFKATVRDHGIPVVDTPAARRAGLLPGTRLLGEREAVQAAREGGVRRVYTTSENAIGWIAEHLAFTPLPDRIDRFKNKVRFRQLTRPLFPDLFFRGIPAGDLPDVRFEDLPAPLVLKPAVGFFSVGVRRVEDAGAWAEAVAAVGSELDRARGLYPDPVLDGRSFIVEQCIDGEEFAVDAYFDAEGAPVVLSILKHLFASDADVSDRVYVTSAEIIEENLAPFTGFLERLGAQTGVRDLPVHVELRRGPDGALVPIEVNPLRFGGWCTTADLTALAYGLNPYVCYWEGRRPHWPTALAGKTGKMYALVVLDNATGLDGGEIAAFDYEGLLATFERPLELRRLDHRAHPVFGFLFTETRADNVGELERVLHSDLREFMVVGAR